MDIRGVQVGKGYYSKSSYNTLLRFISYFYQTDLAARYDTRSILEIGSGGNVTAGFLKNKGFDVTTCDFDKETSPDLVGDIRSIPAPSKSFDAAMAFQVLEHIPFEDFGKALEELKRVSKKFIFISLPYRHTGFEFIFKFPGVRSLAKKDFLSLFLRIPLRFGGFETSGQHHWEIDGGKYRLNRVRKEIEKHGKIIEELSPALNRFHYFFVIKIDA